MFWASDGYPLICRHWRSSGPSASRGVVVALHGIQSHGGWYLHSSRRLASAGYEVYFLDRRGSGLNARDRGFVLHHDRLINDVAQVLTAIRAEDQRAGIRRPVILNGLSWGGKLAAAVAIRRPDLIDAVSLQYPGIFARIQPTWWQRVRLAAAVEHGLHRMLIPIPLSDPALFTDTPHWRDFIRRDPLALHQASTGLLHASVELTNLVLRESDKINRPLLLMLAGRDLVIDNPPTRAWFARLKTDRRVLIEYAEACHTLEFEPDPDHFIDHWIGWLDSVTRSHH